MKKILFALCVCLTFIINTQIYAQKTEYQSVFGEANTVYNVLYSYPIFFENTVNLTEATFVFDYNSDTIINGIEYKEFYVWVPASCGPFASYFLRESEDKSKLYTLKWNGFYEEVLVMDLDLNLQDTFNCWNYELIVENIFYDEENLKHILFSSIDHIFNGNDSYYKFEFIEGIGSTAIFGLESRIGLLLCAEKDEVNVFTNNSDFLPEHIRGKCDYAHWHIGIEDVFASKNSLKIYPNPANNFIMVDFGENFTNYQSIFVYDLLGRPCLNTAVVQEKHHIDIHTLPAGYYILKAIGKDKPPVYGKFSVIR